MSAKTYRRGRNSAFQTRYDSHDFGCRGSLTSMSICHEKSAMATMMVVDCDLSNERGYVVMSDASEFEIVMEGMDLRIRAPSSNQDINDPVVREAVRSQLVRERLLNA